jgi:hypothetical protein
LSFRTAPGKSEPSDISLANMDQLSIYVSNSSTLTSNSNEQCGSPWNGAGTTKTSETIQIDCTRTLKGRFLYVTVPSTNLTYLVLCTIVLNRDKGNANA